MVRRDTNHLCDNETLYALGDANFNVTAMVDANANVVERYTYDPYGKVTIRGGNWAEVTWSASRQNPVLYGGYRYDYETHLYLVRHRMYHPTLGRWLQRDPEGYVDGMSLYEYVGGNAAGRRDLFGNSWIDESWEQVKQCAAEAWDTAAPYVDFAVNVAAGYVESITPADLPGPSTYEGAVGRNVGRDAALAQGVAEIAGGGFLVATGAAEVTGGLVAGGGGLVAAPETGGASLVVTAGGGAMALDGVKNMAVGAAAVAHGAYVLHRSAELGHENPEAYPKRAGSKGYPDHQRKVKDLGKKAESELKAGERVRQERKVQGHPSRRTPDQQIIDRTGKTRKVFEAERRPNQKYHRDRLQEYNDLGIEHETHDLD